MYENVDFPEIGLPEITINNRVQVFSVQTNKNGLVEFGAVVSALVAEPENPQKNHWVPVGYVSKTRGPHFKIRRFKCED